MIETLTQNIHTIQAGLSALSIPAFIMVITSLIKNKTTVYTPYIAVGIGVIIGIIVSVTFVGLSVMTIVAGIIFGAITGASSVGIKVIADGKPEDDTLSDNELLEIAEK